MQNYGSWSPFMVKDGRTCLGLEYFVNEGDAMWRKSDADLVAQGTQELVHARARSTIRPKVEAGYVVRMPKAYPVYDEHYQAQRRRRCASGSRSNTPNVFPCGRNGMHKYNNQDHSMLTAMLSVENILGGRARRRGRSTSRPSTTKSRPAATPRPARTGRDAPFLPRQVLAAGSIAGGAGGAGTRSRRPHHVTSAIASATMRHDIFEVPRTRSVNEIGTSSIFPPTCSTRYVISIWNAYPVECVDSKSIARRIDARYAR